MAPICKRVTVCPLLAGYITSAKPHPHNATVLERLSHSLVGTTTSAQGTTGLLSHCLLLVVSCQASRIPGVTKWDDLDHPIYMAQDSRRRGR